MKVVPVGIEFSNYANFRSELLVNFGKPIPVSDYYDSYKESPAIAINQIKEQLAKSLIPLMIHIKSEKHYDLYNELREIYKNEMIEKMGFPSTKQPYKFQADQELIRRLEHFEEEYPEEMDGFQELILQYRNHIQKQGLDYAIVQKKTSSSMRLLGEFLLFFLASPVFLIGWILNYIPFGLSIYIGLKMEDPQFRSSVKFVISMILYPLFHFLETLVVWFFFKDWTITFAFFVVMPILGILARWYWISFLQYHKTFRWARLKKNKPEIYQLIRKNQQEILVKATSIVAESIVQS